VSPPLWLLDVDGVLNALSARPGRATWPDWEWGTAAVHGVDWPIRFAPAVSAYVTAVHADDRADPATGLSPSDLARVDAFFDGA